jgi:hypothetical protein
MAFAFYKFRAVWKIKNQFNQACPLQQRQPTASNRHGAHLSSFVTAPACHPVMGCCCRTISSAMALPVSRHRVPTASTPSAYKRPWMATTTSFSLPFWPKKEPFWHRLPSPVRRQFTPPPAELVLSGKALNYALLLTELLQLEDDYTTCNPGSCHRLCHMMVSPFLCASHRGWPSQTVALCLWASRAIARPVRGAFPRWATVFDREHRSTSELLPTR